MIYQGSGVFFYEIAILLCSLVILGIKGKDEFLEIYEYEMNETAWEEGFCRKTWQEMFIIKLLGGYVIEKEADYNPEIRNIKIRNQEETKVYQGTMDD